MGKNSAAPQLGKKKWAFPNAFVILIIFCLVAMVMTWVVPAGRFDRVTEGSITKVVPDSFHLVDSKPQNPWDLFRAIVTGFKRQASLIYMTLFVGAAIFMLESTKAIDIAFRKLARAMKGKEALAIFVVMAVMSLGGATGVFGSVTLVLIPIGIFLSRAMGFDNGLGFAMIFFGSFSGFNVGWANFSTIGIAQTIAELPIFSGFGVRVILHICNFILSYFFVLMYFNKIKKDPTRSLNYETGMALGDYMGSTGENEDVSKVKLTVSQIVSLLALVLGIVTVVIGALKFKWGADHISATFLVVSLVIGLVSRFGANGTADGFIKGCSNVVYAAFIIGFANAISVIMESGLILDTIVYYLSIPINYFGPVAGANFMLIANSIINIFISSGSGQATAVMPIMVPIADITGITRQVAVQAFQFGDGFTNCLIPTIGSLMGGLGFAKVQYGRYLKWATPFVLLQIVLACVAITILQSIGWTGL
ncbi:YfcC family protein [Breznakiella homolactica]|uniref:YfcC family protein n=1 Tax=Breznakiella homolactica TaxID=2798577 RepID=A0A7T7XPK1_9SPIR|nr:AbgT family transporter [Breznakiella homolactica]QQO10134.1 AbgT family transporter [Breznakiella homolactica]